MCQYGRVVKPVVAQRAHSIVAGGSVLHEVYGVYRLSVRIRTLIAYR